MACAAAAAACRRSRSKIANRRNGVMNADEKILTPRDNTHDALLETLRGIVGANHVLTEGDLSAWEQDWRKRARGKSLAVVRPGNTHQVAEVVKACAAAGTPIVPQGGNTSLAVGAIPDASGSEIL